MSKDKKICQNGLQTLLLEPKMISKNYSIVIQDLYKKGTAKKAIARLLGIDIKTVRRHLKQSEWKPYERISSKPTLSLTERKWLLNRMEEVGYNARVLWRELKDKKYQGSYDTVKKFIFPYRKNVAKACVRFETEPGYQSQVDWGSAWVWLGEKEVKIHFFALVLGYSRRLYAKGYGHERFINLVDGHEEAFKWFGGMTKEILYDNAKTMVTSHNILTKDIILNASFKDFASYYGFKAHFCKPYFPQTKGKIESSIKYIKRNFLIGRRFRDFGHLNHELETWLKEVADVRIHGTTRERPIDRFKEEKLIPLQTIIPYVHVPAVSRKVSQDAMISFFSNRYSVPWMYVGKCVDLKVSQGTITMSYEGKTIAEHKLLIGKHQQAINPSHYKGLTMTKPKTQQLPQHDPRWNEAWSVEQRDLSVYEQVASIPFWIQ